MKRFKDNIMVFYENDRQVLPSYHNRPLYLTASIHDVDLKHALIDPGFSLNIMPLSAARGIRDSSS